MLGIYEIEKMQKLFKSFLIITIGYVIVTSIFNIFYYLNFGKGEWFLITDIIGVLLIIITIVLRIKK